MARGTKKSAFTGICEDRLVAAAPAAKTRETSMKVSTLQILAHHLADDGAPGAVLLLVAVVIDALELLVIVFHERIERGSARVTRLINGCRCGLHALHNSQVLRMIEKTRVRLLKYPPDRVEGAAGDRKANRRGWGRAPRAHISFCGCALPKFDNGNIVVRRPSENLIILTVWHPGLKYYTRNDRK